ncbi:GNAT family N-acetyltransferase [Bacillus sp. HMF5848]|uniref:GNAT family N-acetyltransferase n=1 Tax=Bacillus sp. HMF5848 TaxID=2495421 RepID=UPI000F7BB17E|nr:GNAT family N-acetyltransferase [Bacillus sp. HMF5848]RSK28404.1 GNAT family N-acetyltransferase [Bacillus sp. HMF5848]
MIRKLSNTDHKAVMEFLQPEAAMNLFIIGDIEAFGYDQDFQEVWGQYGESEKLQAVLLRFYDSFIVYANERWHAEEFIPIITAQAKPFQLSGKATVVTKIAPLLSQYLGKEKSTYYCECRIPPVIEMNSVEIKHAAIDDIEKIINLWRKIDEFVVTDASIHMMKKTMEANKARTYFIENESGEVMACASTTAENSLSAMIVGVCTHPHHRAKGLATSVVSELVKDITQEGKLACLFYDNPSAGRIYKRMGFTDIGQWTMYRPL